MLQEIKFYSKMAWGIRQFLRTPPIGDPDAYVRECLASRDTNFLSLVERGIFNHSPSPYNEMFRLAGCTLGDLRNEVNRAGVEATLRRLREAGVYLTHDEFKAKSPIVRSGREIPSNDASFRNPQVANALSEGISSGSRSKGTRSARSIGRLLQREAHFKIRNREFDLGNRIRIELKPILPSGTGLGPGQRGHREGHPVEKWFAVGGGLRDSGHYRMVTHCLVRWTRLLGAPAQLPTYLAPNDFSLVAEYIARRKREGAPAAVHAFPSPAVRVAAAAVEHGIDISGTIFFVGGEALTDAKRATIELAGAEVYPFYPISEVGPVGSSCRQMNKGNCVHLFDDNVVAYVHRRRAALSDAHVNALQFTSLMPFCPHVLVNAEMDDAGVIGPATCDCSYTRLGLTRQVSEIFSFGKLTGQGMTLVGTDLLKILEEVLPAQLGGAPGDFQLVEREGAAQTEVTLRVNPRIQASPDKIRECFLRELKNFYGGSLASRMWTHANGVQIISGQPYATRTGKIHALHLLSPESQQSEVVNAS
ncbi:MAG: hypothetical protein ABI972_17920 [Acidobacteriota bacterium]